MTKEQCEKAVSIVNQDATLKGAYYSRKGESCVIGGLALSAGVDPGILRSINQDWIGSLYHHAPDKLEKIKAVRDAISAKFGLSRIQMNRLQQINDDHRSIDERRLALIRVLRSEVDHD